MVIAPPPLAEADADADADADAEGEPPDAVGDLLKHAAPTIATTTKNGASRMDSVRITQAPPGFDGMHVVRREPPTGFPATPVAVRRSVDPDELPPRLLEVVEVDAARDPGDGAAVRVLPEGPPVAAPVARGDGRLGHAPVRDPQQAVSLVGELRGIAHRGLPEVRARVDDGLAAH